VRWWNELLGQGIKLRKKLFQFPHIVIAHIALGIQGCSFVICPTLPQNAPTIAQGYYESWFASGTSSQKVADVDALVAM
jgi:hypothetical protein